MAQPTDSETREKRRKLSGILTLMFAGLLAVLSHVDSFFFWVLLGATSYSSFLYFYFRPLHAEPYISYDPSGKFDQPSFPFAADPGLLRKVIIGVSAAVLFIALIVATGLFSGKPGEDPSEVSANERGGDPENTGPILDKGIAAYNRQDYDSALIYYERVLKTDPANDDAIYNQALVYYSQNNYQRSLDILRGNLKHVVEDGNAAWLLGDNYLELKKNDSALFYFNLAYDHAIKDTKFLQVLAELSEKDNEPKALAIYKELLALEPNRDDITKKIAELESKSN